MRVVRGVLFGRQNPGWEREGVVGDIIWDEER